LNDNFGVVNDKLTLVNNAALDNGALDLQDTDYAYALSSSDLTFSSAQGSISLWIYKTQNFDTNDHYMVSKTQQSAGNFNDLLLFLFSEGILVFFYSNDAGNIFAVGS